jgi:hypothetical protein
MWLWSCGLGHLVLVRTCQEPHGTIANVKPTTLQLDTTAINSPLYPIAAAMFLQRSAFAAARRAAPRAIARRTFTTSFVRRESRRESYRTMQL